MWPPFHRVRRLSLLGSPVARTASGRARGPTCLPRPQKGPSSESTVSPPEWHGKWSRHKTPRRHLIATMTTVWRRIWLWSKSLFFRKYVFSIYICNRKGMYFSSREFMWFGTNELPSKSISNRWAKRIKFSPTLPSVFTMDPSRSFQLMVIDLICMACTFFVNEEEPVNRNIWRIMIN